MNGLAWDVNGPTAFCQGDAYQVHAEIKFDPRYRDQQLTVLSGALAVEVTHSSGWTRTHVLFKSGTPKVYRLGDLYGGMGASLDLREAFGELKTGKWTARWVLREGRYQIQGHTDASELVADYSFEIVATTHELASLSNAPSKEVTLDVPSPAGAQENFGTLTNHTNEPIEFPAYAAGFDGGRAKWEEPLGTLACVDRFVPPGKWRSIDLSYCGVGVAQYRLEPGKSVKVRLPDNGGGQFVRYRLDYRSADTKDVPAKEVFSSVVEWPPLKTVAPAE